MPPADETCWTVVRGAAAGQAGARAAFAETYIDVVRAYLGARWRGTPHLAALDDAVQAVFLDCFREDGATRVDLNIGSLDHPSSIAPEYHIWTESRIPWFETVDELPRYPDAGPDGEES